VDVVDVTGLHRGLGCLLHKMLLNGVLMFVRSALIPEDFAPHPHFKLSDDMDGHGYIKDAFMFSLFGPSSDKKSHQ
jgi:hypothetical protein